MAMLLCEVPLNKDTHIERGKEREATAAARTVAGTYYTYEVYLC